MSDDNEPMDSGVITGTYVPTEKELAARRKRNVAIGLGLTAFILFVFFSMLSRVGAI